MGKNESIYSMVYRWRKTLRPTTVASVYLKSTEVSREYGHRKVWRHGLEVAIKIKGSHGGVTIIARLSLSHALTDQCRKNRLLYSESFWNIEIHIYKKVKRKTDGLT